jgi:hypothetical protein
MPPIRRPRQRQNCRLFGFLGIFVTLGCYMLMPFNTLEGDLFARRSLLLNPSRQVVERYWRRWQILQSIMEERNQTEAPAISGNASQGTSTRVLYIVTTLSDFNNGQRNTVRGSDRFKETLVPVVSESVTSMVNAGFAVDVFIVCAFIMSRERRQQISQSLPPSVVLQIWDDAIPLNYNMKDIKEDISKVQAKLGNHSRGLARQHRFVIRDKLRYYDGEQVLPTCAFILGDWTHFVPYLWVSLC